MSQVFGIIQRDSSIYGVVNVDVPIEGVVRGFAINAGSGATGAQGAQGYQGATGLTGSQGYQGATGLTGSQGYQGATGSTGLTGSQGFQGATGLTGSQGYQGATGLTGSQGATGVQGFQGARGYQGANGTQGYQGATGLTGSQGFQGATGLTGSQGYQGATGSTGSQGFQGATGANGTQGYQGATGLTGSQGFQGAIGSTGSTGLTGSQGYQGATGLTGSQGFQGAIGSTGSQGFQGATGSQGFQGATGGGLDNTVLSITEGVTGATWINTGLNTGLVSYIDFNETAGSSFNDSISSYNASVVQGSITPNQVGIVGKCIYTNGTGKIITAPQSGLLHPTTFTFSGWVKPTVLSNNEIFAFFDPVTVKYIATFCKSNGAFSISAGTPNIATEVASESNKLIVNEWNLFIVTYNGSNIIGYVNDVEVVNIPYGSGFSSLPNPGQYWFGTPGLDCYFDQSCVWSRVLDSTERTALLNLGLAGSALDDDVFGSVDITGYLNVNSQSVVVTNDSRLSDARPASGGTANNLSNTVLSILGGGGNTWDSDGLLTNLVSAYDFEEVTGTEFANSIAGAPSLTVSGTHTLGVDGLVGKCVHMGSNCTISANYQANLINPTAFSMSVLINPDVLSYKELFAALNQWSWSYIGVRLTNVGVEVFSYISNISQSRPIVGGNIVAGQWSTITFTYANSTIKTYINSVLVDTWIVDMDFTVLSQHPNFIIAGTAGYVGLIDMPLVWREELTAQKVSDAHDLMMLGKHLNDDDSGAVDINGDLNISGKVGIGITSPTAKFEVDGSIKSESIYVKEFIITDSTGVPKFKMSYDDATDSLITTKL